MKSLNFLKDKKSNKNRLEIYDGSGFIGLINNQLYKTFINEDWELKDVLYRFKTETNNKHCIIWNTGTQNLMTIDFINEFTSKPAFRDIRTQVKVTNESLYLVNYDDLTMCAQYFDEKLPSDMNADLKLELDNGIYNIHIRQMFNPENYTLENYPDPCFEIKLKLSESEIDLKFDNVIWWNE
ncbi:hypothetical protein [uncultured Aquimarina sp.]|uniref:hypothetical protein n=1 Tax=uncultured Aquimarina sp. TaxID=575652 RepID=UPI00262E0E56|nr:hypothetical protein [uncultured Aquimarina sp.]